MFVAELAVMIRQFDSQVSSPYCVSSLLSHFLRSAVYMRLFSLSVVIVVPHCICFHDSITKDNPLHAAGTKKGLWTNTITSFVLNGNNVYEREKMYALLFLYQTTSAHTKSHVMGNALADRILLDDRVRDKLSESTWTTTALHYGLLYGTSGPATDPR